MTKIQCTLCLAMWGTLMVGVSMAQPEGAQKAGMNEGEVKELAKKLGAMRSLSSSGKTKSKWETARDAFHKALEEVTKAHAGTDILSMVDSWSQVFTLSSGDDRPRSPAGKGRVRGNFKSSQTFAGRDVEFNYAMYLPAQYSTEKAWPLIICFHDAGSEGEKYLKEVWEEASKELRNEFVMLAPTISTSTGGKNAQVIGWFDIWHMRSIIMPLRDVLTDYNIDTNRIYLDGTGLGGEVALELSTRLAKQFAAVSARSAGPRRVGYLRNLKGQVPALMSVRKGGIFSSKDGELLKNQILQAKATYDIELEIKEYDPLPNANEERKAIGSQKVDPVHNATDEIGKWFLTKVRDPYPASFYFATDNNALFKQARWARLDKAEADPDSGSAAELEVTVNRQTNTIDCTSTNVEIFRLFVNDRLLDLDKPIVVNVNKEKALEKKIDRSLDFLLDYNKGNPFDTEMVMTGVLRVSVKPPGLPKENADKPGEPEKNGEGK